MARWPETPRRVILKRAHARNLRRFAILQKAGLVQISMWVPRACVEAANQRAFALDLHRQTVLRAALEVGMRALRTSDVQRSEQRWRGIIGLPVAPRYPGERIDRSKSFDLKAWHQAHRNGRHISGRPGVLKLDGASAGETASLLHAPPGTPETP